MRQPATLADPHTFVEALQSRTSGPPVKSKSHTYPSVRERSLLRDLRGPLFSSESRLRQPPLHSIERVGGFQRTTAWHEYGRHHSPRGGRPADQYPKGFPPGSLAEALQMLPVSGQIPRTFLELAHARSGDVQRARPLPHLLEDQAQTAANQFRLRATRGFFQILENRSIFFTEAGMDVGLHGSNVAQYF